MNIIDDNIIDIIGRQIEPRSTAMSSAERDSFHTIIQTITNNEAKVMIEKEKTLQLQSLDNILSSNDTMSMELKTEMIKSILG